MFSRSLLFSFHSIFIMLLPFPYSFFSSILILFSLSPSRFISPLSPLLFCSFSLTSLSFHGLFFTILIVIIISAYTVLLCHISSALSPLASSPSVHWCFNLCFHFTALFSSMSHPSLPLLVPYFPSYTPALHFLCTVHFWNLERYLDRLMRLFAASEISLHQVEAYVHHLVEVSLTLYLSSFSTYSLLS